jgi:hypothetical protein
MKLIVGIIVGNILVWINTAILSGIYGVILGYTILGSYHSADEYRSMWEATFTSSSLFWAGMVAVESVGALVAGYVTAAITKRAELVCGLLATLSWVVASIPVSDSGAGLSMQFRVSELLFIALFGMLGGGLRKVLPKTRVAV